jgi:hypothetical protein
MNRDTRISLTMRRILRRAAGRPYGHVCPTIGIYGTAQSVLLAALDRRGFICRNRPDPVISDAGRAAIEA